MLNELLEGIPTYKSLYEYSSEGDLSFPVCFLVEGVINFESFHSQLQSKFESKIKILEINDRFILLLLKERIDIHQLNSIMKLSHFQIYSIFLQKIFSDDFYDQYNVNNQDFFYLYYEKNDINIKLKYPQKADEIKIIPSDPRRYLYGFKNYHDFIAFYIRLIEYDKIWPIFALSPFKTCFSKQKAIDDYNDKYCQLISDIPPFTPSKFLYYINFIEKVHPKPNKLSNVAEIYSVKDVQDVQISHSYTIKSHKKIIKTFLGFDSKFRCLQVLDFLKNQNNSIFDIELMDNIETNKSNIVKCNLYYLEIQSLFDSSILFSINYNESFNFYINKDEFSTFLSFEKQEDFLNAKKIFKSSINSNFIYKDIKLIDKDDYSLLFPNNLIDVNLNLNVFFIIFRVKNLNKTFNSSKQNHSNNCSLFKESFITVRDAKCILDNKLYTIVGFNDFQKREEAYKSIKNSIYFVILKNHYPEGIS